MIKNKLVISMIFSFILGHRKCPSKSGRFGENFRMGDIYFSFSDFYSVPIIMLLHAEKKQEEIFRDRKRLNKTESAIAL